MSPATSRSAPVPSTDGLLARVSGDPDLSKTERETTFTFAADRDRLRVHTAIPAVVRGILAHDDARLLSATVHDGEAARTVPGPQLGDTEGDIVSIRATLPVGAITVKSSSRKSDQPGDIVSERVFDK